MIGIYMYTNLINGNAYIGQSINIEKRKKHISKELIVILRLMLNTIKHFIKQFVNTVLKTLNLKF